MLRSAVTFIATALIAGAALAATVREPAPAFKGMDALTGKEISNETLKGKVAVLEWNNFDCPFVKKFYGAGAMQKLQADAAKDDVVWVTVNSSAKDKQGYFADAAAVKAAVNEHKGKQAHYLLDHDGVIGKAYGAKTTPHMYVIDKDGKLAYQGAMDDKPTPKVEDLTGAQNYVTAAIASLKAGTAIKDANTKAYGCAVKY